MERHEVDLETLGLAGVAPSKGHFSRSVDPDSVPWEFDPRIYALATRVIPPSLTVTLNAMSPLRLLAQEGQRRCAHTSSDEGCKPRGNIVGTSYNRSL